MILDLQNLNKDDNKVFFGKYSGFQRFDKPEYLNAKKLEELMRNAFWNPNEISMREDAAAFETLPRNIQDVMCSIWFYQTLMDSVQNRGIEETLCSLTHSPEWECLFKTWSYFEMIHSISYSHIIRGIFMDSSPVFERNFSNTKITERVSHEVTQYNDLVEDVENANAEDILKLILTIYALEGIKFYASFLITYLIHDKFNAIPGATRIIKLINFDEDMHTNASVELIKTLRKDSHFSGLIESEWFTKEAHKAFRQVLEDEKSFASYLIEIGENFESGKGIPVSYKNICKFLEYYVDKRLADIGVAPTVTGDGKAAEKSDLVGWFEMYKDLNKENVALQESDLAVYNIGTLKNDL